jgi:hypothetical protein
MKKLSINRHELIEAYKILNTSPIMYLYIIIVILTLSGTISTLSNSIPLANKNFASSVVFTSATVPFNISSPIISAAALGRFTLYFLDADLVTNNADNRSVLLVFLVADTIFFAKEELDPVVNRRYMVYDRGKKIKMRSPSVKHNGDSGQQIEKNKKYLIVARVEVNANTTQDPFITVMLIRSHIHRWEYFSELGWLLIQTYTYPVVHKSLVA